MIITTQRRRAECLQLVSGAAQGTRRDFQVRSETRAHKIMNSLASSENEIKYSSIHYPDKAPEIFTKDAGYMYWRKLSSKEIQDIPEAMYLNIYG